MIIVAVGVAVGLTIKKEDNNNTTSPVKKNIKFMATGKGDNSNILYSTDGLNWSSAQMSEGKRVFGNGGERYNSIFDGVSWFAVGKNYNSGTNYSSNILYSEDGTKWLSAYMSDNTEPFDNNSLNNYGKENYGKAIAIKT